MSTDPQYPDRPTHPDYTLLAQLVRRQERATSNATGPMMQSLIGQCVDPDTAAYVAKNQGIMFVQRMDQMVYTAREMEAAIAGAFITGLVLGVSLERERALANQPPLPDV